MYFNLVPHSSISADFGDHSGLLSNETHLGFAMSPAMQLENILLGAKDIAQQIAKEFTLNDAQ